ncbi:HNH endonuclease [Arthrobacter sp. zg-Y844]|nr:HNH endonuclease [Arthrobacter sp. zg-Y844]
MVTISHDALLLGLTNATGEPDARNRTIRGDRPDEPHSANGPDNRNTETSRSPSPGIAAFSGPIDTRTVRRIACDADLIPVVLGSKGQVLDLGRAARLFPPHLRKALHARDRGCAFPGCTVPGPWTEAHHVTFWERGGDTSIGNGVLLCSFHHHLIHQGNWPVSMQAGIPWFRPPAYVDPERRPLRNTYFHPGFPASGGTLNGT